MMRSNAATNPLCRHRTWRAAVMVILTPAAFECCWTTTSLPDPLRCSSSHRAGDPYDRGANDFRDHWADTEPEWSHGDT
jgi:hypothetical protein